MNFAFPKSERLCSRRLIEALYSDGHRLMAFPYSVQWRFVPDGEAGGTRGHLPQPRCQVLIVAPKRKFRHAVDRNRVKRLTRECWRMRKHIVSQRLEEQGAHISLALVYVHNEILGHEQLGRKMDKLLDALAADIDKHRQQ